VIADTSGTNNTGTSNSCILLGVALDFSADGKTITLSPVLGFANSSSQTLAAANPQIWSTAKETYLPQWQANVAKMVSVLVKDIVNVNNTDSDINRLLFVRNVQSEDINFYATHQNIALASALDDSSISNTRNVPTLICVQSDDGGALRGAIQVKGTGRETSTNINAISSSVDSQSQPFFNTLFPGFGGVKCG
jgi:hypothetical protein